MAADPDVGMLIDRRARSTLRPFPPALLPVDRIELGEESRLSAWLVRASDGTALPRKVESPGFGRQMRLLDRFYLPSVPDTDVVTTLFDTIASVYDVVTDRRLNASTAALLLDTVAPEPGASPLILDFGCGTGLAFDTAVSHASGCRLIGTDISSAMLRIAAQGGNAVIDIDQWRAAPPVVDGVIACFVVHYGLSDQDMRGIASGMRPGAAFAANLHRMNNGEIDAFDGLLLSVGLPLEIRRPIGGNPANLLSSYRKLPW